MAEMGSSRLDPIQTIVMMDFETTGLIQGDEHFNRMPTPGNMNKFDTPSKMPRITELSFVSVPRALFSNGIKKMESKFNCLEDDLKEPLSVRLPVNVHTRQVCPKLTDRQWLDYEESRRKCEAIHLSRAELIHKNSFADEWPGVVQFLNTLNKPAVIIAHNGAKFDFRLLYAELKFHDLLEQYPIPDGIYFLDSYWAFLDLESEFHESARQAATLIEWPKISELIRQAAKRDDESSDASTSTTGDVNLTLSTSVQVTIKDEIQHIPPTSSTDSDIQIIGPAQPHGYTTPPRTGAKRPLFVNGSKSEPPGKRKRLIFDELDNNPLNFMRTSHWSPAKKRRLRRMFFERVHDDDWRFSNITARDYFFGRKGNFKLANLYTELINEKFDVHRAQADCEALLQVCLAFGKDFLDYADKNRASLPFLGGQSSSWAAEFWNKLKGGPTNSESSTNADDLCTNLVDPAVNNL